jgi:hypothetical protein
MTEHEVSKSVLALSEESATAIESKLQSLTNHCSNSSSEDPSIEVVINDNVS